MYVNLLFIISTCLASIFKKLDTFPTSLRSEFDLNFTEAYMQTCGWRFRLNLQEIPDPLGFTRPFYIVTDRFNQFTDPPDVQDNIQVYKDIHNVSRFMVK